MEFSLTDEQQQLRRTVREFAEGEIAPHVMEWDEASKFPAEIIPKLAEMGFLGVIFPEKYGTLMVSRRNGSFTATPFHSIRTKWS